ncbi:DUF2225 domain-containing protein [Paenibacillus abyssi]|uniref:DUF2225 domain-containing protein n=1 Tax=Paenibacillus abyssi TaxID=1340531 RepID=A0A917FVF9_9BACL|nr:DUF2225 domain-containing protein [Paenibacillus abyssi]GGG04943.1 hypothetical protein GCM10010916_22570 [Paenibacillus abyssi]
MLEPLYQTKIQCVCCETPFETSRVRTSFKKVIKRDTDFCAYYKEEHNPEYYVVRVCPSCGFSSTENSIEQLNDKQKNSYLTRIGSSWSTRDYGGTRSWEQAMETYKLALICAQTVGEKDRVISGLLHHIAWLYRYKDNKEQEMRFLRFALESYIRVYEVEGGSVNNARLMYLIGELHRRVDEPYEAVKWFGRVINDKKIVDAAMIRASREQWQLLREEMTSKKLELPEEMQSS